MYKDHKPCSMANAYSALALMKSLLFANEAGMDLQQRLIATSDIQKVHQVWK